VPADPPRRAVETASTRLSLFARDDVILSYHDEYEKVKADAERGDEQAAQECFATGA
jgi:hypothetical protein